MNDGFNFDPATPATTPARPKPRLKPRKLLDPAIYCHVCGREKCVFWRGKAWCIHCDERELFGTGGEG